MNRVVYYILALWVLTRISFQQDVVDDGNDDDDTCSYISGQNCNSDGICKYCAMCLQSSCILSKTVGTPVCNTTQFGTTNIYDWYGYCLSSGNDNSGDYCATSTECYQYRRNNSSSTNNIWKSLTCDPTSCLLVTDKGQPAPSPGALPPNDNPSASSSNNNNNNNPSAPPPPFGPHHQNGEHNPTAIALSVTCTLIFVGILAWLFRLWKRSRYWLPPFLKGLMPPALSSSSTSIPNSAPPSFRSTVATATATATATAAATAAAPEMACITPADGSHQQRDLASSSRASSRSFNNIGGEPLPSYFSPDPSPPKYEHAIVTQIRGLLEDSNYHYQSSTSSSMNVDHHTTEDSMAMDHYTNEFPPPMWVPIYFAPNHTSFSLGRLRHHPSSPSSSRFANNNVSRRNLEHSEQDLGSSSAGASSVIASGSATSIASTSSSSVPSAQQTNQGH